MIGSHNLHAASANLSWKANNEPDLAKYNIYQRTLPSTEYSSDIFSGMPSNQSSPQIIVNNLAASTSYGFIATAIDTSGNESAPSNEVILATASDGGDSSGGDSSGDDGDGGSDVGGSSNDNGGFIAYNDLAWGPGQLTNNITMITSPNGKGASSLPRSGQLLDFATGLPTPVSMKVIGGRLCKKCPNRAKYSQPKPGTDAHRLFNGIVTTQGAIAHINKVNKPLVLKFTGLNPNRLYDLAFFSHRNKFSWDHASLVTISGQKAFTNISSTATDNPNEQQSVLFTGPTDASTRLPADNDNGYVARFSNINPGENGVVKLTIKYDGSIPYKGKYGSAVRLHEMPISSPTQ